MLRALSLLVLCFSIVGCGSSDSTISIKGKVTLDGQPVEKGDIYFTNADPQFGQEAGKIANGEYSAKVHPGQNKVAISATREVPGKFGPMGTEPLLEDAVPAKYKLPTTSNLSVNVTKEKKDGYDFPLESK
ncbi:hypothetical protein [Anatilimnocola floriformis]|uniref:hypothetical protein n=1 Tax=Anatilimnocola floriformis TaxID=2948575 RepID=UPI0020C38628|nr:hypothetical protein [Anatilimnocola floriformis]